MRKITHIIIHHTATKRDTTTFEAVKNYHVNQKGWGDIGYNWLITADGVLHEGRPQDKIGAHTKDDGMNYKSLGIVLTGNFDIEKPTEKQIETLKGIVSQVRDIYKIPAENVLGHQEVKGTSTACPGKNLMPIVKDIRGEIPADVLPEKREAELLKTIEDLRDKLAKRNANYNILQNKYTKLSDKHNALLNELDANKSWLTRLIEKFQKK